MRWVLAGGVMSLAVVVVPVPARAQALPPIPTFKADTTAIVVDVIVRDKKGRPVTDLKLDDFELREDGIGQVVRAMTLVAPDVSSGPSRRTPVAGTPARATPASGGEGVAPPGNTVVALVFDRLSPEARDLAYKAAATYAERPARPDDFVGVFQIDLSLKTLQTYTNDRARLRAAIDTAARTATSVFGRDASRVRPGALGDRNPLTSPTAGAESPGPATPDATPPTTGPGAAAGAAQAIMNQVTERTENAFELMSQEQEGTASTVALRALVTALGVLPGRKTLVYFTEGLSLPDAVVHRFDSLVELANQRNVAIYTVDAAGLRVQSGQAAAARGLRRSADAMADIESQPDAVTQEAMGQAFDRSFTDIRSDPHAALDRLATLTGGFLVENTNNLAAGIDRIESDRRFHYLLTYTPANSQFNGEYRRITVSVKRPGLVVRARSGYTAVREPGTFPTLSYEAAPLAVLARTPAPSDVPVVGRSFRLPDRAHPGRVAMLVRVPAGAIRYDVPSGASAYRADFTILARIKDERGEVVRKASQPYRLTGPASDVAAARSGDVVFFRSPDLPAGRYTVEYVVYDAVADRAGVGTMPLEVPAAAPNALVVSDLFIVRSAEKADAQTAPENPLRLGDLLLYPNLGEPFVSGRDQSIPVFVGVLPSPARGHLTARLAIARERQTLAEVPLALEAPDATGRIAQVSRISVGALPPGDYAIVVSVNDGASTQLRSVKFAVAAAPGS